MNKNNSSSSFNTSNLNQHSILKKEKSNKNDSIIEFRNEIKTILNEFKQFPEKIKIDLKNEIINEVTNLSKNYDDSTLNLEKENINLYNQYNSKNATSISNNLINYQSPTFSSLSRDNIAPNSANLMSDKQSKIITSNINNQQSNHNNLNYNYDISNNQFNNNNLINYNNTNSTTNHDLDPKLNPN